MRLIKYNFKWRRARVASSYLPCCHAVETQVRIEIEGLMDGIAMSESLTRAAFEELNKELFQKTVTPLQQVSSAHSLDVPSPLCRAAGLLQL